MIKVPKDLWLKIQDNKEFEQSIRGLEELELNMIIKKDVPRISDYYGTIWASPDKVIFRAYSWLFYKETCYIDIHNGQWNYQYAIRNLNINSIENINKEIIQLRQELSAEEDKIKKEKKKIFSNYIELHKNTYNKISERIIGLEEIIIPENYNLILNEIKQFPYKLAEIINKGIEEYKMIKFYSKNIILE